MVPPPMARVMGNSDNCPQRTGPYCGGGSPVGPLLGRQARSMSVRQLGCGCGSKQRGSQRSNTVPPVKNTGARGSSARRTNHGSPPPRRTERVSRCSVPQQNANLFLSQPTGLANTINNSPRTPRTGSQSEPTLDITSLDIAVGGFLDKGIAASTRTAYRSAQRRYAEFCTRYGVTHPYPLTEHILCRYVAFLAKEGLKHRTIKAYLSGIRYLQIMKALGNPFEVSLPRLEYVLTGVKRAEAQTGQRPRTRLPITIDILKGLKEVWLAPPVQHDSIMLWAAACTGFFGFLRAGEFSAPSTEAYDPEVHLNLSDLAIDKHAAPTMV